MSKSATISIALDEDAYLVFQNASEIVSKAGIRVSTGQLVQTMINAEISRLSARKIAQRFLKSVLEQVGTPTGQDLERMKMTPFQACPRREGDDDFSRVRKTVNQPGYGGRFCPKRRALQIASHMAIASPKNKEDLVRQFKFNPEVDTPARSLYEGGARFGAVC